MLLNDSNTAEFTAKNGITFKVRVVLEGDRHGAEMCLTHGGPRFVRFGPLVEIYDTRCKHVYLFVGPKKEAQAAGAPCLGQFVASYYARTFLDAKPFGLDMCGHVPDWKLDFTTLMLMQEFVDGAVANSSMGLAPFTVW